MRRVIVLFLLICAAHGYRPRRRLRVASRVAPRVNLPQTRDLSNAVRLYVGEERSDGEYRLVLEQNGTLACDAHERYAIIVHGWRESCATEWVTELVGMLHKYRGGCILCMDYSQITDRYRVLVAHFKFLHSTLTSVLMQLEEAGFDPSTAFMFGFSFGARVVTQAAGNYGYQRISRIDVCDPARPGFDRRQTTLIDPEMAARNVQCIHTSRDKGTLLRNCHQDWLMGNCGFEQEAASEPPLGSHGLCPYFYVSAFEHEFCAVPRPQTCFSTREVHDYPPRFRMGYLENRTDVRGDLYALTSLKYPYNVDLRDSSGFFNK